MECLPRTTEKSSRQPPLYCNIDSSILPKKVLFLGDHAGDRFPRPGLPDSKAWRYPLLGAWHGLARYVARALLCIYLNPFSLHCGWPVLKLISWRCRQ